MQNIILIHRSLLLLILIGAGCLWVNVASAETTITNSVRVSADGTGESKAAVTTIINGEVVEDWSASSTGEPIEYASTVSTNTNTTVYAASSHSQGPSDEELKAIISQLEALISLYVSLLQH